MKRPTLTICALLVAAVSVSAKTETIHPLELATYEATRLCGVVNPDGNLESCGNIAGRSEEHSAARLSMMRLYKARAAFMNTCQAERQLEDCTYSADWLMLGGFTRALDEEQSLHTRSLPRSDTRR